MPQKVDSGSPIRLPFDQFQPVDKALGRPVTPDERSPSAHGRFILEQPFGESPQLLHTAVLHLRNPGVKSATVPLTDHATEGLDLMIRAGHRRIEAEEMRQEGLIGRALVFRSRQKQAGCSEGGQWRGAALVLLLRIEGRRRGLATLEPSTRLPPQLTNVPLDRPPCRLVPLRHELPPELLRVPTAGVPPPSQIWGEGRHEGLPAMT
jgi:hypothetical protein